MTGSAESMTCEVLLDDEGEIVPERHVEYFEKWKPVADTIPERELKQPNVEGSLAHANAEVTADNLMPFIERGEKTAGVDVELIKALPGIALAYVYTWSLWNGSLPLKPELVGPLLKLVRRDRKLALLLLEAAAMKGIVEEEEVEKIRRGTGNDDAIQDLLSAAILLRGPANGILKSGLFITEAELVEAEKRAVLAERASRPQSANDAPKPITDVKREALRLQRDRFFTLLSKAYAEAELLAVALVGINNVRTLVPSMMARRKKKANALETVES